MYSIAVLCSTATLLEYSLSSELFHQGPSGDISGTSASEMACKHSRKYSTALAATKQIECVCWRKMLLHFPSFLSYTLEFKLWQILFRSLVFLFSSLFSLGFFCLLSQCFIFYKSGFKFVLRFKFFYILFFFHSISFYLISFLFLFHFDHFFFSSALKVVGLWYGIFNVLQKKKGMSTMYFRITFGLLCSLIRHCTALLSLFELKVSRCEVLVWPATVGKAQTKLFTCSSENSPYSWTTALREDMKMRQYIHHKSFSFFQLGPYLFT